MSVSPPNWSTLSAYLRNPGKNRSLKMTVTLSGLDVNDDIMGSNGSLGASFRFSLTDPFVLRVKSCVRKRDAQISPGKHFSSVIFTFVVEHHFWFFFCFQVENYSRARAQLRISLQIFFMHSKWEYFPPLSSQPKSQLHVYFLSILWKCSSSWYCSLSEKNVKLTLVINLAV